MAAEATQKALALSAKAPARERDYIQTLAKRYSIEPSADLKKLAMDFHQAMGELSKKYPDDLDAVQKEGTPVLPGIEFGND